MCLCNRRLWRIFCLRQSFTPKETKCVWQYLARSFSSHWLCTESKHSSQESHFQIVILVPFLVLSHEDCIVCKKYNATFYCTLCVIHSHDITYVFAQPAKYLILGFLSPRDLSIHFLRVQQACTETWYLTHYVAGEMKQHSSYPQWTKPKDNLSVLKNPRSYKNYYFISETSFFIMEPSRLFRFAKPIDCNISCRISMF